LEKTLGRQGKIKVMITITLDEHEAYLLGCILEAEVKGAIARNEHGYKLDCELILERIEAANRREVEKTINHPTYEELYGTK